MSLTDQPYEHGQHRRHRGHRTDAKVASQIILHCVDFIAHRRAIGNHLARPSRHMLAFRRQSVKALAPSAQKNRDAKLQLKLLYSAGETWLAHMDGALRSPDMSLLGTCHHIFEL